MTRQPSQPSAATVVAHLRLGDDSPCLAAMVWVDALPTGTTPQQAWDACQRADWMLWCAEAVGVGRVTLTRCACACARTLLQYVPEDESRPLAAIEAAEAWCDGHATEEEVAAAGAAAGVAAAAAWAAWAAADADTANAVRGSARVDVWVAANAATNAGGAAGGIAWVAAGVAGAAARIAADTADAAGAAANVAGGAAWTAAQKAMAVLVRGIILEPLGTSGGQR